MGLISGVGSWSPGGHQRAALSRVGASGLACPEAGLESLFAQPAIICCRRGFMRRLGAAQRAAAARASALRAMARLR